MGGPTYGEGGVRYLGQKPNFFRKCVLRAPLSAPAYIWIFLPHYWMNNWMNEKIALFVIKMNKLFSDIFEMPRWEEEGVLPSFSWRWTKAWRLGWVLRSLGQIFASYNISHSNIWFKYLIFTLFQPNRIVTRILCCINIS